ncbi:phosphotransferase [Streptomyces tendae]|uniref:phosphotransferase n=1 Tax=Streptomyces tendae TaxID=1932 RepID=UPI00367D5D11
MGVVQIERGYANNRRWLVRTADGCSVFAKQAADEESAQWLRTEWRRYSQIPVFCRPRTVGWFDDGARPVMFIEDLSGCRWPPPWRPGDVEAVLETLRELAAAPAPPDLPPIADTWFAAGGWPEVAAYPERFLNLGLCTRAWLDNTLPVLLEAASFDALNGSSVLHLDVRSDNLCFRAGQAVLVDWNLAALGNADFDVAFWLPSLCLENGPAPDAVYRGDARLVAVVAGFFAAQAGRPSLPRAPAVRQLQRRQLAVALPWALRALGLPPLDLMRSEH